MSGSSLRGVLVAALVGVATITGAGASTGRTGAPPSVTAYGQLVWNLDALVNDTFGHRRPCLDEQRNNVFSVPQSQNCPSPLARYADYRFTFLNAFRSQFRLVRRFNPWAGVNVAPFTIDGRYVYCGSGRWLGLFHGGGLWPFGCDRP
jgi:hypothetical protein